MKNRSHETHHFLPVWLEKTEEDCPEIVIQSFFNYYNLPQCRFYLWQMLKWYGREKKEETLIDSADCIYFFEKIMSFIEATYLVQQKNKLGIKTYNTHLSETKGINITDPENPLSSIISIIQNSMDVEKIFLLGTYPAQPVGLGEEYDLLVLVNDSIRANDEFESLIQNRSTDTAPVYASVFKISKVNEMILAGNYFLSTVCVVEKLIYDAGRIQLSNPPPDCHFPRLKELMNNHTAWMEKASGFIAGAIHFHESEAFSLCGFMLHQATEHALNSLLQPLMQFRTQSHNLHKLIRITRRFSLEIFNVFPRDTDYEIKLFQLLQKAYIHARYKDSFEVKEEDALALLERTKLLLQIVTAEFERIVYAKVEN